MTSHNLQTQHNILTSHKGANSHPIIITGLPQDSKQLSLPNKGFKEHEIQTQVMETGLYNCTFVSCRGAFIHLFASDPTRASRIRNKGGLCGVKQLQLVSASLSIYPRDMNGLNYFDLHRADK